MAETEDHKKPKTVLNAEYALWIWTAWTCLFGIYQTWVSIPEAEQMMSGQLQGVISISPGVMLESAAGFYAFLTLISIWTIIKISAGRHWARSTLMVGFVLEIVSAAMSSVLGPMIGFSGGGTSEILSYIPDLGLQAYAVYLLYTPPGKNWFDPPRKS